MRVQAKPIDLPQAADTDKAGRENVFPVIGLSCHWGRRRQRQQRDGQQSCS